MCVAMQPLAARAASMPIAHSTRVIVSAMITAVSWRVAPSLVMWSPVTPNRYGRARHVGREPFDTPAKPPGPPARRCTSSLRPPGRHRGLFTQQGPSSARRAIESGCCMCTSRKARSRFTSAFTSGFTSLTPGAGGTAAAAASRGRFSAAARARVCRRVAVGAGTHGGRVGIELAAAIAVAITVAVAVAVAVVVAAAAAAYLRKSTTETTLLEKHAATLSPRAFHATSKMPPPPLYVRTSTPSLTLHMCR
mmetsp:Transcript_17207/g.60471  ORF Transcript_17207/g.60471 Transcript_17207/m.60471 type:complete len:250 (-) Transcript_17207:1250-1999(-)